MADNPYCRQQDLSFVQTLVLDHLIAVCPTMEGSSLTFATLSGMQRLHL